MKIYKLEQEVCRGWDTYDSIVVCAESEEDAKLIHPNGEDIGEMTDDYDSWPGKDHINDITVELIGVAKQGMERGVVLASFNSG